MKLGILDFFRDVGNFFKGGTVLGVDIGTASVKAVELTKKGDALALVNYGVLGTRKYLDEPNQAIQTSSLRIVEKDAANLLKSVLREMRSTTKLAIASLPIFSTFTTVLDMPALSKEETAKAIRFQAQQYIPLPPSEVSIEWFPVEDFTSERGQKYQRLLLVGIPNEVIATYKRVYKAAGLTLLSMEIEPFSLLRAFRKSFTEEPVVVADIGAESTGVMVVRRGNIEHVEQTDYSGIYLTKALAKSLDISMARAEELKCRRGISAAGADAELSTLLLPFLDVIIQEVKHVQTAYERRAGVTVGKVMLSGGGANLIGIEPYVASQMGLPVAHHPYFLGIGHPAELEPETKRLENELAVACGLAERYFS